MQLQDFQGLAGVLLLGSLLEIRKAFNGKKRMKTIIRTTLYCFLALSSLVMTACGKSDNNSTNHVAPTSSYYLSGNNCINSQNGQVVPYNYCTNSGGYYQSNGACYTQGTNQVVDMSYCNNLNNTSNCHQTMQYPSTGSCAILQPGGAQQCIGYYYQMTAYGPQYGYCNGYNCRGYTLYQYGTNQVVTCQ